MIRLYGSLRITDDSKDPFIRHIISSFITKLMLKKNNYKIRKFI